MCYEEGSAVKEKVVEGGKKLKDGEEEGERDRVY